MDRSLKARLTEAQVLQFFSQRRNTLAPDFCALPLADLSSFYLLGFFSGT